ncbi:MAG: flavin reductase family protein [Rhodoferax sp.]|nr:flavin reductase family protein [Rhodoferax sp.]
MSPAVSSLSAERPSLLVCVNRSAPIAPALFRHAHFSVNVLAAGQLGVAKAFGGQSLGYADGSYHAVG